MDVHDLERRLYAKVVELRRQWVDVRFDEAAIHLHPFDHEDVELHHDPYLHPTSRWEDGEFVTRVRGIRTRSDLTVAQGEAHLILNGTRLAL